MQAQLSGRYGMKISESLNQNRKLGIWNVLNDPYLVPALYKGLDFAIIDLEHGFRDFSQIQSMLSRLGVINIEVFVRIRNSQDVIVQSLLDLGISNFIIPQVRTLEEIEALSRRVSFPPNGIRGFHPRISRIDSGNGNNPSAVRLFPIIETCEILSFQKELVSLDAVAGFYFGNFDLSLEMQCSRYFSDPVMFRAFEQTISAVTAGGKRLLVMPSNESEFDMLSARGISEFVIGIDSELLYNSVENLRELFR